MIDLIFSNHTNDRTPGKEFFKKVLETATREIKKLRNKEIERLRHLSVSVNLVGESKIKALNKKYRHKNKSTDVLAFPLKKDLEIRNLKLEIDKDIGDVFVCLSIAKKEATRENISINKKLTQLTAHGFLHLLGYDHERSKRSAEEMFELEDTILSRLESFLKPQTLSSKL